MRTAQHWYLHHVVHIKLPNLLLFRPWSEIFSVFFWKKKETWVQTECYVGICFIQIYPSNLHMVYIYIYTNIYPNLFSRIRYFTPKKIVSNLLSRAGGFHNPFITLGYHMQVMHNQGRVYSRVGK